MKLLITGSSGLIGDNFLCRKSEYFSKIYTLGRSPSKIQEAEHIYYDFSSDSIIDLPEIEVVVHCAAQTSGVFDLDNMTSSFNINSVGTGNLLAACLKLKQRPFVLYLGTATQLGYTSQLYSLDELPHDSPTTLYDLSKLGGEMILENLRDKNLISGVSLRLCNVYGKLNKMQKSDRGILDKVYNKCLVGDTVSIIGDGEYLRDYVHVDDVADAMMDALLSRESLYRFKYYIGSGRSFSLHDAFSIVRNIAYKQTSNYSEFQFTKISESVNPIHLRNFQADIGEFCEITNWKPTRHLQDIN